MKKWVFCNEPLVKGYYDIKPYCPKCGSKSGLVNILGLCATKIYKK